MPDEHQTSAVASAAAARTDERRTYHPPRLRVYGDLYTVTLSSQTQNKNDPGNSARTRT